MAKLDGAMAGVDPLDPPFSGDGVNRNSEVRLNQA